MAASLETWIDDVHAGGRYSFLREEVLHHAGLSPGAATKALQRSTRSGRVVRLKEYFYVVVPLEYRAAGSPPASWFIRDLMAAMKLPYYVGLLSAAGFHGSSHQQPQVFQVITDRSVRPMHAGRSQIQFFASKYLAAAAVTEVKTPTGPMCVSTPETTAVDLVRFSKSAGHLDHVSTVIAELAPSLDPQRLLAAVRAVGDVPNAQRLGYVLDAVHHRRISEPIYAWLKRVPHRLQALRPGQPVTGSRESRRWKLLINTPIEAEA